MAKSEHTLDLEMQITALDQKCTLRGQAVAYLTRENESLKREIDTLRQYNETLKKASESKAEDLRRASLQYAISAYGSDAYKTSQAYKGSTVSTGTFKTPTHWGPVGDGDRTRCCHVAMADLPRTDRVTMDEDRVWCPQARIIDGSVMSMHEVTDMWHGALKTFMLPRGVSLCHHSSRCRCINHCIDGPHWHLGDDRGRHAYEAQAK